MLVVLLLAGCAERSSEVAIDGAGDITVSVYEDGSISIRQFMRRDPIYLSYADFKRVSKRVDDLVAGKAIVEAE